MSIEVTARHMDAKDGILEYARKKADAVMESFPRVENVHVILDVEKHYSIAEVVIQAKNRIRIDATESRERMNTAIDDVFDKVEVQLRKLRDKSQDKRRKMKFSEVAKDVVGEPVDEEEYEVQE